MRMDLQYKSSAFLFCMAMAQERGFAYARKHLQRLYKGKPYMQEALLYPLWLVANGKPLPEVMQQRRHYKRRHKQDNAPQVAQA